MRTRNAVLMGAAFSLAVGGSAFGGSVTDSAFAQKQGKTGKTGKRGPRGTRGPAGATGPAGPQGPAGPGVAGPAGDRGAQGERGTNGTNGTNGAAGATGPAGPAGAAGARGADGAAGPRGADGAVGPRGPQGPGAVLINYRVAGNGFAPGTGVGGSAAVPGTCTSTSVATGPCGYTQVYPASGDGDGLRLRARCSGPTADPRLQAWADGTKDDGIFAGIRSDRDPTNFGAPGADDPQSTVDTTVGPNDGDIDRGDRYSILREGLDVGTGFASRLSSLDIAFASGVNDQQAGGPGGNYTDIDSVLRVKRSDEGSPIPTQGNCSFVGSAVIASA